MPDRRFEEPDVEEYVCLTLRSRLGEAEAAFKARLSTFWTGVLRITPADFEKVYAEAAAFERLADRLERRYLIEAVVADSLAVALTSGQLDFQPIDPDDLYSKYEAAPPEWFWIEH